MLVHVEPSSLREPAKGRPLAVGIRTLVNAPRLAVTTIGSPGSTTALGASRPPPSVATAMEGCVMSAKLSTARISLL